MTSSREQLTTVGSLEPSYLRLLRDGDCQTRVEALETAPRAMHGLSSRLSEQSTQERDRCVLFGQTTNRFVLHGTLW